MDMTDIPWNEWNDLTETEVLIQISCILNRDGGHCIDKVGLISSLRVAVYYHLKSAQDRESKELKIALEK